MSRPTTDVARDDIKSWLIRDVAPEIEELRSSDVPAEHCADWYKGILAWLSKYYIDDDPDSLVFPDGPGDGGIDIASIATAEDHHRIRIYQISVPALESIGEGRIIKGREKFVDDIRRVRNVIIGQAKRLRELNPTALEVVRKINHARDFVAETPTASVSIEIQALSLKEAHPDARREVTESATEALDEWSADREKWVVQPVRDLVDLYRDYQRKRPKEESPEQLTIHTHGKATFDHAHRGPFLCFVSAYELVKAYEQWGAGLLDSNLRYSLGATDVNKIIEAALRHPASIKWFHERNNGIVITCNSCTVRENAVNIAAPQIVNGGQTVHSILAVLRELESIPLEQRTPDDKRALDGIKTDLRLSARFVVVSGGRAQQLDEIAIASNTQNKLSDRTMHSTQLVTRDLRLHLAGLSRPWFAITKDGEWESLVKHRALFQSKTGNKQQRDFLVAGNRYRKVDNTDLGVAVLAFWGFASEAKPSRVFTKRHFDTVFGFHAMDNAWSKLAKQRVEWRGKAFQALFEAGQSSASVYLLAYFSWLFWKHFTYPESRQLLGAYEEEGARNPEFRSKWYSESGWHVSDDERERLLNRQDSCYWTEQIAKSAYLVLTYQTMRVLVRAFGELTESKCRAILQLPQVSDLYQGTAISTLTDFRKGSLSDGPLSAIGRMLHYACALTWSAFEPQIRSMASRQQVLLQEDWIARLSDKVDLVCTRIGEPVFRHAGGLEGPLDRVREFSGLQDVLGKVPA